MTGTQETQKTQLDTQRSQYEMEDTSHLNARLVSRNLLYSNIDLVKGITKWARFTTKLTIISFLFPSRYTVGRKNRVNDIVMPQEWKRISECYLNIKIIQLIVLKVVSTASSSELST